MIEFKLTQGFYIRKMNEQNWVVCETITRKEGNNIGEEAEKVLGYFSDLVTAQRASVKFVTNASESNEELLKVVADLKEIYSNIK